MTNHTGIGILASLLLLSSCGGKTNTKGTQDGDAADASEIVEATNKKFDENGVEIIDLGSNFKLSDEPFPMSEIVDPSDVQYIKLETTGESILRMKTPYVSKVIITNDGIYISEYASLKSVYRFNRTGKFINHIGKIGQGPGEYKTADDFAIDDSNIYMTITDRPYLFCYNIQTGKFEKKIKREMYSDNIVVKSNNNLLFVRQNFCMRDNFFTCIESDSLGNIIKNYVPDINVDLVNNKKLYFKYQATPLCLSSDHITLFEALDNYIYREEKDSLIKRYRLDMGRYTMPMNFVYEMNRSSGDEMFQYFRVFGIQETVKYLVLNIMYKDIDTYYYAIYNKIDGKVLWKDGGTNENSFLYNDIDGGASAIIYPFKTDANYLYTLIYPHMAEEYLQEWRDKTVKYPEKRAQLCKLLSEMEEDDNPILVLYKKK